jgi:hypothetical protein
MCVIFHYPSMCFTFELFQFYNTQYMQIVKNVYGILLTHFSHFFTKTIFKRCMLVVLLHVFRHSKDENVKLYLLSQ